MPADPTQWGLPADAVEVVEKRAEGAKVFQTGSRQYTAILSPDIHYQDEAGDWQEVDTDWQDSTDAGYTDAVDKAKYRVRMGSDGKRRIYPRRHVLDEYIEFAPLQARVNNQWRDIPWSSKTRSGNTITLDRSNASLTATLSGNRFKIDITLKDSSAATPLRWPVSLTGLTRNGWSLVSNSDGSTVMEIDPLFLTDAEGTQRDVTTSIQNGAVQFTADVSDLVYPVVVDPTSTFNVAVSGDDGTAGDTGLPGSSTTDTSIHAERSKGPFGTLYHANALVRFDTSSLPDTATISSATLRVYPNTMQNDSGRNYIGEYYSSANWPITSADYSSTITTTAFSVSASTMTTGAYHDIALSNLGNINLTGYTGFRIGISGSDPSNGNLNKVYVNSFDNGSNAPQLLVTYTAVTNYSQTLTAAISASPTMQRGVGLTRSKVISVTPTMTRGVGKILSKVLTVTPSVAKSIPRSFSTVVNVAGSIVHGLGHSLELLASVSVSATKRLGVGLVRSVSATVAPTMRRRIDKTLTSTVATTVSSIIGRGLELVVTVGVSGSLSRGVSLVKSAVVAVTGSETHGFSLTKVITATVAVTSSLSRSRGMAATRAKIRGGWIWVVEETRGFISRRNR